MRGWGGGRADGRGEVEEGEEDGAEVDERKRHRHLLHLARVVVREDAVGELLEDARDDRRRCLDAARLVARRDRAEDARDLACARASRRWARESRRESRGRR